MPSHQRQRSNTTPVPVPRSVGLACQHSTIQPQPLDSYGATPSLATAPPRLAPPPPAVHPAATPLLSGVNAATHPPATTCTPVPVGTCSGSGSGGGAGGAPPAASAARGRRGSGPRPLAKRKRDVAAMLLTLSERLEMSELTLPTCIVATGEWGLHAYAYAYHGTRCAYVRVNAYACARVRVYDAPCTNRWRAFTRQTASKSASSAAVAWAAA